MRITKEESKQGSFLQEALRRRIIRTLAGYIVIAWAIVQAADIIGPAFNLPEWTVRFLITVLLIGFPFVAVLSWIYDFTGGHFERTRGETDTGITSRGWFRGGLVAMTGLACAGGIWWVWSSEVLQDPKFAAAPEDAFPKVIAVTDFRTIADAGSEWLGEGIANLVRDNLSQSGYLRVVSPRRWLAVAGQDEDSDPLDLAADAGIRYLLQGEVIGSRRGFLLTVRLMNTANGEQLDARTFDAADVPVALQSATAIAQATRANLKVPIQENVDVYSADFAAENPSAYRAFVSALEYWINFEYEQAERMLEGALELQPEYAMARYYLAWAQTVQDRVGDARANLAVASASEGLSERDRLFVDALGPYLERQIEDAAVAYKALLEEYPYETEAIYLYAETLEHLGQYDEALAQYQRLSRMEPEVHVGWSGMAYVHMLLGNYEQAGPAIDRFAQLAPDNPNVYVLRGDLHRAMRRLDDARRDYAVAADMGSGLQEASVSLATVEYLLGNVDASLALLEDIIGNTRAVPRYRIDAAFAAGGILNSQGRFSRHIAHLDALQAEIRSSEIVIAKALSDRALAMLATGETGDAVSELMDEAIELSPGVPTRYLFARGLLELARENPEAATATAAEIRGLALPPDNPDRTEDRAADYLLGRVALLQGKLAEAEALFRSAVDADGYAYKLYELGLAEAYLAGERHDDVVRVLGKAVDDVNPLDVRLDLELDRALARLTLARALRQSGREARAQEIAERLRSQWAQADPDFAGPALLAELQERDGA